jgi:hypothetical protein
MNFHYTLSGPPSPGIQSVPKPGPAHSNTNSFLSRERFQDPFKANTTLFLTLNYLLTLN